MLGYFIAECNGFYIYLQGSKGLEPNLFGIDPDSKRKPKQNISKQLPKDEAVFQK